MDLTTAMQISARIWCDPEYSNVVMNSALALKIANLLMKEANKQNLFPTPPSQNVMRNESEAGNG